MPAVKEVDDVTFLVPQVSYDGPVAICHQELHAESMAPQLSQAPLHALWLHTLADVLSFHSLCAIRLAPFDVYPVGLSAGQ